MLVFKFIFNITKLQLEYMFEMQARILLMQLFHKVLLVSLCSYTSAYILAKIFRKNCWWIIFSPLQYQISTCKLYNIAKFKLPTPNVSKSQHQNVAQIEQMQLLSILLDNQYTKEHKASHQKSAREREREGVLYQLHHCQQGEDGKFYLPCLSFKLSFFLLGSYVL